MGWRSAGLSSRVQVLPAASPNQPRGAHLHRREDLDGAAVAHAGGHRAREEGVREAVGQHAVQHGRAWEGGGANGRRLCGRAGAANGAGRRRAPAGRHTPARPSAPRRLTLL
jgi:hypothetical protein